MTTEPWIIHLSEQTRVLARDVLGDLVHAVGNHGGAWNTHRDGDIGLLVPRAARVRIGRRGAGFVVSGGDCRVSIPDRGAPAWEQLRLSGRIAEGEDGAGPTDVLLRTLHAWSIGLGTPVDAFSDEAARSLRPLALLGRGVAEHLEQPWDSLRLNVGENGRHSLDLQNYVDYRILTTRFASMAEKGRSGSMSAVLVAELDRLRGTRVHAWEEPSRLKGGMPCVHFGSPPPIRVENDGDVITAMRAIAATPRGAELLP